MAAVTKDDAHEIGHFLADYAKGYHAGAFATPLPRELPGAAQVFRDSTGGRTVIVGKRASTSSKRTDWRGRAVDMPRGAMIATHVARDPGSLLPDELDFYDLVCTYVEDAELTAGLRNRGWVRVASQITAAAEVKGWWAPEGARREHVDPWDAATVADVTMAIRPGDLAAMGDEAAKLTQWADDFPYYSDGSWSSISLRGFWPDDPTRGVKPSEMPAKWKAEHPGDLDRVCDWTSVASLCPTIRGWVESVPWWGRLERVRLLRMEGTGKGALGRHTDITDRDAGTRDGAITRFHTPLVTHPAITMTTWDLDGIERAHHLERGRTYYLDARKPHAVTNPTRVDRVHLVADVVSDKAVRDVLAEAPSAVVA